MPTAPTSGVTKTLDWVIGIVPEWLIAFAGMRISVSGHKRTAASTEYVERLLRHARTLREAVAARMGVLRGAVLAQARARPIDELDATAGSEIMLPKLVGPRPRKSRPRRVPRQR